MSMYNMIFGNNPFAWMHLVSLGTDPESVPRFRDCYLLRSEDGTKILVLTRTGSEEYSEQNAAMEALPGFQSTYQLRIDATYRVFLYEMRFEDYEERIRPLVEAAVDKNGKRELYESRGGFESLYGPDPDERWSRFMADLESGVDNEDVRRAMEGGREIFRQMGIE